MQCPNDQNPLIILQPEETEIDYCPGCGGVWLDRGELEILLKDEASADSLLGSFQKTFSKERQKHCPVCAKKMEKVLAGQGEKFLIDRCQDHGLWFDAGELAGILEHSEFRNSTVLEFLKNLFHPQQGDKS